MLTGEFHLPAAFDLTATFLFAITGTLAGMRRHYDIIGVFVLAFAAALGGGLIRDGVFLAAGPPIAITNVYYVPVVTAAVLGTILVGRMVPLVRRILSAVPTSNNDPTRLTVQAQLASAGGERRQGGARSLLERINLESRLARTYVTILSLVDALGLGIYAVVGAQKSLDRGLPLSAAILVGAVNAVGGGLLRDVLTREVPLLFQPGQFYALTAVVGAIAFVSLVISLRMDAYHAALVAIALTFVLRVLAIRFDWRTPPMVWDEQR
jgi:uncharacterized membrane protein YeiH